MKYVRRVGIKGQLCGRTSLKVLESGSHTLLADSPDGLLAANEEDETNSVDAVEIKTMTMVRTRSY